ncbi:ABC transporter permease [Pontibacter roseus]|uniref:ABC transporter permease n=1 Tax=Pontibacter roseus TaxID=336989 RepID=UPI00036D7667|nr:ABC transporter permease [Pontibacter roseus]
MLRNYFKTGFRNLVRQKVYSVINIAGLAAGIAACILIFLYVKDELSYDRHHAKADKIYRVTRDFVSNDGSVSLHLGHVAPPFGPLLEQDFPQIESIARLLQTSLLVENVEKQKTFREERIMFAEPAIFDIFDIPIIDGSRERALKEPFTLLLSNKLADKYFPGEEPVGQLLKLTSTSSARVTGVFQSLPDNSHFHPDILVAFNTLNDTAVYGAEQLRTNWGNNSFGTYMVINSEQEAENMQAQLPAFMDRHLGGTDHAGDRKPSDFSRLYLQKLTDIHLRSHLDSEMEANGDINTVMILAAVALVILLIACINYINLSTARYMSRAKEVGVRKVVGAEKHDLVFQFLSESILIALIATLLAVGITELCLPWLNEFTGKNIGSNIFTDRWLLGLTLLLPLLVGGLAGLYPAFYLSRFLPAMVLKGSLSNSSKNPLLRKTLVVVQFSISIILIIATGIMFRQLVYMQNKDLGFEAENVVILPTYTTLTPQFEAFKSELKKSALVEGVGRSLLIPSDRLLNSMGASVMKGDSMAQTSVTIKFVNVDHDLLDVFEVQLAAGRNFDRTRATDDTAAYILNNAAARMIGWQNPQEAIDQVFAYGGRKGRIIGVTEDFHFESLHDEISPMVYMLSPSNNYTNIAIRINGDTRQALAHIEQTWRQFLPGYPFEYSFLDQLYAETYKAERDKGVIFLIFSCIAILIACLGLFGLASYTTVQRTKEIGIRKVFGASVMRIVTLLSKDFLKLVLVANLLAWPIAWYAMRTWLNDFAYRIEMGTGIFLLAALLAFIISVVTISYQAVRAASANPVKSLRTE